MFMRPAVIKAAGAGLAFCYPASNPVSYRHHDEATDADHHRE